VLQVGKVTKVSRAPQDQLGLVNRVSLELLERLEPLDPRVSRAMLGSLERAVELVFQESLVIEEHPDLLVHKAHQVNLAETVRSSLLTYLTVPDDSADADVNVDDDADTDSDVGEDDRGVGGNYKQ